MSNSASTPVESAPPEAIRASKRAVPRRRDWLFVLVLAGIAFLAYRPSWHGGWLWDDDSNLTRLDLNSWQGMRRIWLQPLATPQYYPLVYTTFWIEHHFWGDDTLGYHLVNVGLHIAAAALLLFVLRRMQVPGAWLAAGVFALHPVAVESVAWITERKNTLSTVFYLAAMLCYLRFDESRSKRWYASALALFVLALLSKTVTATLPAALWVVFWWRRGRLAWRRDVLPLAPLFALAAAAGAMTIWVEQATGAHGTDYELTAIDRLLVAGRNVWFYLGKLLWPADLNFVYPRWRIDRGAWWQYLYPLGAMLLLSAAWGMRRRNRGPLAALLFFGGTLLPVLGFVNVYYFRFSFVADHFQYLASLGLIALFSAGVAWLIAKCERPARIAATVGCVALLGLLARLTWRQNERYGDIETLYRTTLSANPECWMAYSNLGALLTRDRAADEPIGNYETRIATAKDYFQKALTLRPNYADAHVNLGMLLAGQGEVDRAIEHYQAALKTQPGSYVAYDNLGLAFAQAGRLNDAVASFDMALKIRPLYAEAHCHLGAALLRLGRVDEAIAHFRQAIEIQPNNAEAHNNWGIVLAGQGNISDAIAHYERALEIHPGNAEAHNNLANALARQGKTAEAIAHYEQALEIRPDYAEAHYDLGVALARLGRTREAIAHCREAAQLQPNQIVFQCQAAWALATNPDPSIREGAKAVEFAECAARLSGGQDPTVLDVLAAAYAETGEFSKAVDTAKQALALARARDQNALEVAISARLKLYQAGSRYRDTQ